MSVMHAPRLSATGHEGGDDEEEICMKLPLYGILVIASVCILIIIAYHFICLRIISVVFHVYSKVFLNVCCRYACVE